MACVDSSLGNLTCNAPSPLACRSTWFTYNYANTFWDEIRSLIVRNPIPGFTYTIPVINGAASYTVFGTTGLPWLP